MKDELKLENIRSNLIRQEETIIFAFIERSQFAKNRIIYQKNGIKIPNCDDSFLLYLLNETEKTQARVRRYTSPDEHAFTNNLPNPMLEPIDNEWPIKKTDININHNILEIYINNIIPIICKFEEDFHYGSSAVCDITVLQALSKRIHYGKYVAESKYLSDEQGYNELIIKKDKNGIFNKLTNKEVEKKILKRVQLKSLTYGQDPEEKNPVAKIDPEVIKNIYLNYIIPLTKEVEYLYLMKRI